MTQLLSIRGSETEEGRYINIKFPRKKLLDMLIEISISISHSVVSDFV